MFHEIDRTLDIINGQKQFPQLKPHYMERIDYWTLTGWKEKVVGSYFDSGDILDKIEKLEYEIQQDLINQRNTTWRPHYIDLRANILTLDGLTESAKRDTGEVSTTLDWISLGTSSTAETESDHGLTAEDSGGGYARRRLSTSGSRKVTNQTAKYGVLFDSTMVSSVPKDFKEAGLHWASSGTNNCHAHVTYTTFSFTTGDLLVAQINELMENGTS